MDGLRECHQVVVIVIVEQAIKQTEGVLVIPIDEFNAEVCVHFQPSIAIPDCLVIHLQSADVALE